MIVRVIIAVLAVVSCAYAQGETSPARQALERVMQAFEDPPQEGASSLYAHFTDAFQQAVPLGMLTAQFAQLDAIMGDGVAIERFDVGETPSQLTALVRSPESHAPFLVRIFTAGELIAGLQIIPAAAGRPDVAHWGALDERLGVLPGSVSMCAMRIDGEPSIVHGFHSDERLAIGSTFKLYVLGALGELIVEGRASWDEALPIKNAHKSLPSGIMQNLPPGTQRSIERYAELMISISDNTATDHLIHRVGRERVEAYMQHLQQAPALPLLTTMEMFRIKLCGDKALGEAFAQAREDERRGMLEPGGRVAQAKPNLVLARTWSVPTFVDTIEWFATTEELCRVMGDLSRLEKHEALAPMRRILRINPGVGFMQGDWPSVAYKGGSEPGVLNLTWLLERADGRVYALALTWNNPDAALDETALLRLAGACVGLLRQDP